MFAVLLALALLALYICSSCGHAEDASSSRSPAPIDGRYVGTLFDGQLEPGPWRLEFPALQWNAELLIVGGELVAIAEELLVLELFPPELGVVLEANDWTETGGTVRGFWTPLELEFELLAAIAFDGQVLATWSVWKDEVLLQSRRLVFERVE